MNYNYGRFVSNKFEYAPRVLIIGDKRIINPKKEHFIQAGYKKIIKTEMPVKDGYYYASKIVDINGIPTQQWEEYEIEGENI